MTPLEPGWLLYAPEKKRAVSLDRARALRILEDFTEDDWHGRKAAVMALDLVETQNADPRLLAVLLERAADGEFGGPGGRGRGANTAATA